MNELYNILSNESCSLAILIDPDKTSSESQLKGLTDKLNALKPDFIFVGGSTVDQKDFDLCIQSLKELCSLPIVIFPGSSNQISEKADGILFLSLLSGRNPDYLIGHQIRSAHRLKRMDIEVIPTAYLLIDGGKTSAVAYVSQTTPIPTDQTTIALNTSIAGEMMGMKAIFLDAGSGAENSVPTEMVKEIHTHTTIPVIVGGGIKTIDQYEAMKEAGANLVVIGNKIEEDSNFLLDLLNITKKERFTSKET
ncbi:MAG: geranylgeranylglyceryl/heptaprenylglyceryl phosphate synthase [Flavobacteriales bacterium]|nr:geranylgeranylglyceryl/heptaprenylglyceryl phosphate synthase [Flavobacteriales bacterium]